MIPPKISLPQLEDKLLGALGAEAVERRADDWERLRERVRPKEPKR
jgi:hypothetical protein